MKTVNFGETLAFGIVSPTADLSTTSLVQETFGVRMKEGFAFGKALVPERFSSTIFFGEGTFKRKNYRSDIRCKIGSKPKLFSESCFVTPKRADKIFKSEVKPPLPSSKQTTVNRWFSSSVSMMAREFNCGLESIQIEQPIQSAEMVLTNCPDKCFADSTVIEKDCDFNQNIATRYGTRR